MAIISASRRTDIPAFYSEWFINRIKKGYMFVPNPMRPSSATAVSLRKKDVDCIVFWTKNAKPMLEHLADLEQYPYYFQYTINGYGKELEPGVPTDAADTFVKLSEAVGKEKVIWRYDPICISKKYTVEWHKENFRKLHDKLNSYTEKCVISFVDMKYQKTQSNAKDAEIREPTLAEINELAEAFNNINKGKIEISTCCEAVDLGKYGITKNKCIDPKLIKQISGRTLDYEDDKQRKECGCMKCIDIGRYHTCKHMCSYCYATRNHKDAVAFICDPDCDTLGTPMKEIYDYYYKSKKIVNIEKWIENPDSAAAYATPLPKGQRKLF